MSPSTAIRGPPCCWRSFFREVSPRKLCRRSFVTVQTGPVQKLDLPANIPKQYWSQLPSRLKPDQVKRKIVIHKPPPSERNACKEPIKIIDQEQMALLDPSGARARLFDPSNPDGAKAGDIILATFKSGEPFSGIALSIKWRGPHTSVLLRNHLTRVGTEMDVKVFSPLVQSMEIAQKSKKRMRRARLYYLRKPEHDPGSVQKVVDQYLKQRASLTGSKNPGRQKSGSRGGQKRR